MTEFGAIDVWFGFDAETIGPTNHDLIIMAEVPDP